ncbi:MULTISPECIES: hypothetical protein [Niastella]|uniref:SnoaL-like domain-containing protein n=1 Tax=Niastella soli TaxID=2821487 RepID=A0ABS3YVI8_9BACT|nr:hypothetical protein [Niastella soli]MBO9201946.1 hypothetical protein [Niastella soli]
MKFIVTFIITLLLCKPTHAQKYPQSLIDSFSNETIEYYYTDFINRIDSTEPDYYKPGTMYMLKSELTKNLKTHFKSFTLCYVTHEQALDAFVKTEDRSGSLENLSVTQLKDTINIDIGGWVIQITKVKTVNGKLTPVNSNFLISCGGTLGYIPTCRFVFDKTSHSWKRYTWQQTAAMLIR